MRLLIYFIAVAVILSLTASAGEQNYKLQRLSPDEGLSQGYVNQTIQDNQGYIWIATQMGLNIYDGYQVKPFVTDNGIFAQEDILTLALDDQGNIWVSASSSGLFRIDAITRRVTPVLKGKLLNQQQKPLPVYAFDASVPGSLWLGAADKIFHYDRVNGNILTTIDLHLGEDIIRDLLIVNTHVYAATSKGLYRADIETGATELIEHRPANVRPEHSTNTKLLLSQPGDRLLVGTVEGLYQISTADSSIAAKTLIPSLNIWDLEEVDSGFYIATSQGLYQSEPGDHKVKPVLKFSESEFQISDDKIIDIFEDKSGNLWLASAARGVMIWSPDTRLFTNHTATSASPLSHDNVWSIYQDTDNLVWFGTSNGLNKLDLTTSLITNYITTTNKDPYQESYIYDVYPRDSQHLWLVTALGLKLFNKTTGQLVEINIPDNYQNFLARIDNVFHLIEADIFAILNPEGHYIYNVKSGELLALPELDQQAAPALTTRFLPPLPGYQDTLLLGTSGRLISYHLKDKTTKIIYREADPKPEVLHYPDSWALDKTRNMLWLAMVGEGIIGLDFTTFDVKHRITTNDGLASSNVYDVNIDDNDTLWFSSQLGLYRLNLTTLALTQYEVSDGISANEFNGAAAAKLSDGRLAYGSSRGVTLFNPKELVNAVQESADYRVYLTDVSLMSRELRYSVIAPEHPLQIQHDDVGLTFKFSSLAFKQQAKTQYNISLTGPQTLSYNNIRSNSITFAKLAPGQYQLRITAQSPVTGEISKPTILKFKVRHWPWLSPSAKVTYLLLVILLVWIFSNRNNYQRKLLLKAHLKLLESQEQMSLALKGSDSFIWDYHILTDELYQDRITQELGYDGNSSHPINYADHKKLIHQEDLNKLRARWLNFVGGTSEIWDVSFRMKAGDGRWIWYRDVGRVASRNNLGLPTRLTGTYTNITKTKTTEIKALLFGEAFSQIKDWVLILDRNKKPVSANKAFYDEFSDKNNDPAPTLLQLAQQIGFNKLKQYITLLNSLEIDQSWHGEETVTTPNRGEHPIRISVNAIGNTSNSDNNNVEYFVLIVSDITKQKKAEKKLRYLANYDHLTRLPNRAMMLRKIESAINHSSRQNSEIALFFIDLDRFKQVNDSLGHGVGDKLLQSVAERLKANIKSNDCVARQSGDEFIILIESYNEIEDLEHIASRINQKLSEPMMIEQHQVNVSSSIGIATYPKDASCAADLIRNADIAMFHAKKAGRNRYKLFTDQMDEDTKKRHRLERELKQAIENRELINYYQPIFDPCNNEVAGFELLLRWPVRDGFISPAVFIPIAEEIGLISQITEVAIDQALIDIKQWSGCASQPYLSINLSAVHILQPGFVNKLVALLSKHRLPTSVLRLEITESILMEDKAKALACLTELNDIGLDLFLDDFGTGYSSLTYIKQFPIKAIKIDQSFVRDIGKDPTNESIIKTIISLADNLNIHCIAEGVETTQQLDFLTKNGCDKIQGYLISKPIPIDRTVALLTQEDVAS